jgi:SnoaL-like domain
MADAGQGRERGAWIEKQARTWILVWNDGDPRTLPLADDFAHTSPYGRIEGRETYLDTVIPQAKANVMQLTVEDVIAAGGKAVVRYRMAGPSGSATAACDWLEFVDDRIARVWSYYDRSGPRS